MPKSPYIGQNWDGCISDFRISGQSLIKVNCDNSRTSDGIDTKRGPVTKLGKKNKTASKKFPQPTPHQNGSLKIPPRSGLKCYYVTHVFVRLISRSMKLTYYVWFPGRSSYEVSTKYVNEKSSNERCSCNRQLQRIFLTIMSRPEPMLMRQDWEGLLGVVIVRQNLSLCWVRKAPKVSEEEGSYAFFRFLESL